MTRAVRTALALLMLLITAHTAAAFDRLPEGVWFLRITNPADAPGKLCVRAYFNPNRDPWHGDTLYFAQGAAQPQPPAAEQWLAPGQSTEWVDIGPRMSASPTFGSADRFLSPVLLGAMYEPTGEHLRMVAELATGPDKNVVRKFDVNDPHPTLLGYLTWLGSAPLPTLALLVPVHPDNGQKIWTAEEAARQQLDWITAVGPAPEVSRQIHFISHQWQVAFQNPTQLQKLNTEIVRRLGYNLTQYAKDAKDLEGIRALGQEPSRALMVGRENAEKAAQDMKDKGLWDLVRFANFGDEINIELKCTPEEQDAAFVAYLRERGFEAMDFVRPADEAKAAALPEAERWQFVHLGGSLPTAKTKLFYEAATFRYILWNRELAADTAAVRQHFPADTETGANFSPHLSVWPDVRKWVNLFRDGGMTMPWSEDWWWQVPEASPQSYGFMLDALRLAADYHGAPMCFYTIPDPGETPEHLLRMNYYALGHQAKVIDHFAIYNQIFGTCDYIDFVESEAKYAALHRIMTDVGKIDQRLYEARMRPAEVGIVLSIANDAWNTEDILSKEPPQESLYYAEQNVDNHERKALYLALRHAQIPVDLITDEDIATGVPKRFKVLYIVGQELLGAAAPQLRQWVEAGGTLVAVGGGGILDQYRAAQPALLELYGLKDTTLERPVRSIGPERDLPKATPLDTLTFNEAHGALAMPVYCSRQRLTPISDAEVVGRFADGSPAAIDRRVGQGRVLLIGALPGLAYLQPSQVDRKDMPEAYSEAVRRLIVAPVDAAQVQRPVTTSDPLVEATLQEGGKGAVVTLTSFRNRPLGEVLVMLPSLPNAQQVTSLRHGPLEIQRTPAGPQVVLPLDIGDFLLVD